uniref:Uncharacterized protein n=1 Tax=Anguilla anguilla TaxID=7936 RepID=A0A0E9WY11_ANGAN
MLNSEINCCRTNAWRKQFYFAHWIHLEKRGESEQFNLGLLKDNQEGRKTEQKAMTSTSVGAKQLHEKKKFFELCRILVCSQLRSSTHLTKVRTVQTCFSHQLNLCKVLLDSKNHEKALHDRN